jgi:predicted nuclease of predicted toxin-antitoxin system
MRILFDNNVDHRFHALLNGHESITARSMGWAELSNGELIRQAEAAGFPVIITADKNLRYQQTLKGRKISIIILAPLFVDLFGISPLAGRVLDALDDLSEGTFVVVEALDTPSNAG